jgi:hypothetical protein
VLVTGDGPPRVRSAALIEIGLQLGGLFGRLFRRPAEACPLLTQELRARIDP